MTSRLHKENVNKTKCSLLIIKEHNNFRTNKSWYTTKLYEKFLEFHCDISVKSFDFSFIHTGRRRTLYRGRLVARKYLYRHSKTERFTVYIIILIINRIVFIFNEYPLHVPYKLFDYELINVLGTENKNRNHISINFH